MKIGYHNALEQFPPGELLALTAAAERAGFDTAMCSDHFHPWSARLGQSGNAWVWLGAALARTALPFGVITTPWPRNNPAVIAQAAATLASMYPERFWIALGSGLLLNEHITGDRWPSKRERSERLHEAVDIIRSLWAGETVSNAGHIEIDEARLFTRPEKPPLLFGAAISPETAEWTASWADGLLTVSRPADKLRPVVEAFRRGGGEGKPMYLFVNLSYARNVEDALEGAWEQWRQNIFKTAVLADLRLPEQFDALSQFVTPRDVTRLVNVSTKTEKHVQWLREYVELGFEHLYLHNVNRRQAEFIEDFGTGVLPELWQKGKVRVGPCD